METPDLIGSLHDTNDPDLAIPNVPTSHELPANSQHTASFFCDLVDKIVLSAEARQAIKETSNERFDGIDRDDATESPISEDTDNIGGPLNQDEIEHLSVACAGNSHDQRGFTMSSWEAMDGDSLSSLISMLETHVNPAAALDLVTAAFSVSHEADAFDEVRILQKEIFQLYQFCHIKILFFSTTSIYHLVSSCYAEFTTF